MMAHTKWTASTEASGYGTDDLGVCVSFTYDLPDDKRFKINGRIATVHVHGGSIQSIQEAVERAHLIAAAPELLAALVYARRFLKPEDHDTEFVDAAIKKAKG